MSGALAEAERKGAARPSVAVRCPMDSEEFETPELLSQHVDQVHIGPGLLQAYKHETWEKPKKREKG